MKRPGEIVLTKPDGPSPPPPQDLDGETLTQQLVHIAVVIDIQDPMIKQEGRIRVRAFRGEDEIRLGTLRVRFNKIAPPPDQNMQGPDGIDPPPDRPTPLT